VGDCGLSPDFSRSLSLSRSRSRSLSPLIGKVGLGLTAFEARPYGLDLLWRVGLGKELGRGWEREALKLEEGRGSCLLEMLLGGMEDNECVVVLGLMSAMLAARMMIYNEN
jgi:hypothetical protein